MIVNYCARTSVPVWAVALPTTKVGWSFHSVTILSLQSGGERVLRAWWEESTAVWLENTSPIDKETKYDALN